jgi:hypothetical protein
MIVHLLSWVLVVNILAVELDIIHRVLHRPLESLYQQG